MTEKRWYFAGLAAAAVFAAACCCLDHVKSYDTFDHFAKPSVIATLIACVWMLIAGIVWSRTGIRAQLVGSAIFNIFLPILVGFLLSAFNLDPNIHGMYAVLIAFELFSVLTAVAMLLGTLTKKKTDPHA